MSSNPFYKEFDDLLQVILTDYKNLDSNPDVSEGSITFIKAACLSSMLWGLYRYQDYLAKQIFPDSCDTDNLNHYGSIYGITRLNTDGTAETDSAYASRIISYIQEPPAGGTAADYRQWAKDTTAIQANGPVDFYPTAVNLSTYNITVNQDWVPWDQAQVSTTGTLPVPLSDASTYWVKRYDSSSVQLTDTSAGSAIAISTQGAGLHTLTSTNLTEYYVDECHVVVPPAVAAGRVDLVIVPNNRDILEPTSLYHTACTQLETEVGTYVDTKRPVTADGNSVYAAELFPVYLEMTVTPLTVNVEDIKTSITNYCLTLQPGDPLYLSQIIALALAAGASNAVITNPATDQFPTEYQLISMRSMTVVPIA